MNDQDNIILTGFMGSGKTTVGQRLAERLGRRFVDTDELVVARDEPAPRRHCRPGSWMLFNKNEN